MRFIKEALPTEVKNSRPLSFYLGHDSFQTETGLPLQDLKRIPASTNLYFRYCLEAGLKVLANLHVIKNLFDSFRSAGKPVQRVTDEVKIHTGKSDALIERNYFHGCLCN